MKCRVVEEFIQELKTLGWSRDDAREMVVNGLLGRSRKHLHNWYLNVKRNLTFILKQIKYKILLFCNF